MAIQCEQFASGPHQGSVAEVPSPSPFVDMQVETPAASPRSPFQNAGHNPVETSGPGSPIVVSHPFVTTPVAAEPPPSQSASPFQLTEGGPVRLTRFVEMPLDVCYARVNGMIQSGVFEDIGRSTSRRRNSMGCVAPHRPLEHSSGSKAAIEMWGPLSFGQPDIVIPWHCR